MVAARSVLTAVTLLFSSLQASAIQFEFSYLFAYDNDFGPGFNVTGSFDAESHKHGYVYGISNVKMAFNGVEYQGPLYISGWRSGDDLTPEPVVSFAGYLNRFVITTIEDPFIDTARWNEVYRTGYFFYIQAYGDGKEAEVGAAHGVGGDVNGIEAKRPDNFDNQWKLTSPEFRTQITSVSDGGVTLALLGFGLSGVAFVRRKFSL